MFGRLLGIPEPHAGVVKLVQQYANVPPRNLCHGPWHFFIGRPSRRERTHVLEVARGHPHVREKRSQVTCEPVHHLASPSLSPLALDDLLPYVPIEQHELSVDAAQSSPPRRANALDQRIECALVVVGDLWQLWHKVSLGEAPDVALYQHHVAAGPRLPRRRRCLRRAAEAGSEAGPDAPHPRAWGTGGLRGCDPKYWPACSVPSALCGNVCSVTNMLVLA